MGSRISLLAVLLSCFSLSFSQDCIPDQSIKDIGFFPRVIEDAVVGEPYKQVLQIRVFPDTVIDINGNPTLATIDSINVNDILGFPDGFYYTCSRKNCSYIPDSTGCAVLFGNPTASQVGTYPLQIAIQVYAKVFNLPSSQKDTLDQFTVVVTDEGWVIEKDAQSYNVYPNPSSTGIITLSGSLRNHLVSMEVFNLNGMSVPYTYGMGTLKLDVPEGVYIGKFQLDNGNIVTKRLLMID